MRPCLDCRALTFGTRCPRCAANRSAPRRAYKAQRYDAAFRTERSRWADAITQGARPPCSRCGQPVGLPFDLDHTPSGPLQPAHPKCNRSAG